ncbi:MAG: archaetidylserine decarboxylase [Thiotrichales bacterium]
MQKNLLILLLGTALVMLMFSAGQLSKSPEAGTEKPEQDITLPAFTLISQDNQVLNRQSLTGSWSMLFFGYTHCDKSCVDIAEKMAKAVERVPRQHPDKPVKALFISIDPERDTPAVLRQFMQPMPPSLQAGTPSQEMLNRLTDELGVVFNREPVTDQASPAEYAFDHSLQVFLFDPGGRLAHTFYPEDDLSDITGILEHKLQDLPPMSDNHNKLFGSITSSLLYALPHHLISRATYRLSRVETPWIKNLLIGGYTSLFTLNMQEALQPDPKAYASLNALFTRALKPEVRPVFSTGNSLHASADGVLSEFGNIEHGQLIQAKGFFYSAEKLLGDSSLAAPFQHGQFHTIYLSPKDYHRVHMPITGILTDMVYVPGRLFSVSPTTTRHIPELFTRNERVVAFFDTEHGRMAVVLVGAINVAAIETIWAGLITPPPGETLSKQHYSDGRVIKAGIEMGRFNMGSTVVVLTEKGFSWIDELKKGMPVKMGQTLGNRDR